MNILCIDTATEACSVALMFGDKSDGIFELCPQQQSQRILPMVDEVLTRNNLKLADLDLLAYGRGPGSFTGVRIASSTIQGLALGADLPVAEVSTLAAMAQESFERFACRKSIALIDARMAEVYAGRFGLNEQNLMQTIDEESVLPPQDLLAKLGKLDIENADIGFVGTGFEAYAEELGLDLQSVGIQVSYPNALYMLKLAEAQFKAGIQVSVEHVSPVYLRDKVTWKKLPGKE